MYYLYNYVYCVYIYIYIYIYISVLVLMDIFWYSSTFRKTLRKLRCLRFCHIWCPILWRYVCVHLVESRDGVKRRCEECEVVTGESVSGECVKLSVCEVVSVWSGESVEW